MRRTVISQNREEVCMRLLSLFLLFATICGCSTTASNPKSITSSVQLTYNLSLWTVDERRLRIGKVRNNDAKFDQTPSIAAQGRLLKFANSSEIQIASRCHVNGARLVDCYDLGTSPDSPALVSRARSFVSQFRISAEICEESDALREFRFHQDENRLPRYETGSVGELHPRP